MILFKTAKRPEIHLRQSLSEEPIGDELSEWQQVSSGSAERSAHCRHSAPGLFPVSFPSLIIH